MSDPIVIRKETFEEFYGDISEIIIEMADICALAQHITQETLPMQISGKNFYISETMEILATFYVYLFQNLNQLNSFYSKAFEYLLYVAEQLNYTDEQLAGMLEKRFEEGGN